MLVKNLCTAESNVCPGDNGLNYECLDCNLSTAECTCIKDDPDHEASIYCYTCNDVRHFDVFSTNLDFDALNGELVDEDGNEFEHYVDIADTPIKSAKSSANAFYGKCRHRNFPITFPDETVVFASSQHSRPADAPEPDLSLYLDWSWQPSGPSYYLDWRDYDLPTSWLAAAKTIIDVYQRARQNLWVEVGCIGGHGRTGTAVAAMAVLSGIPATEAVEWVQTNYCEHAVETNLQAWWVEWFAAWFHGTDVPSYPRYDPKTKQTTYIDIQSYEGREDNFDLDDENFHALWIDAHTAEGVDTSEKIIQENFSVGSFYDEEYDPEWKEDTFEAEDGTRYPVHYLTHVGHEKVFEYLDGLDVRTHQYIARFYYTADNKVNSFAALQEAVCAYEEEAPEHVDEILAMDLSEFIELRQDDEEKTSYIGHYSLMLGDELFTFFYSNQDDIGEADKILDSLDGEAEKWVGEHLPEEFDLAELVQAVKAWDAVWDDPPSEIGHG